MTENMTRWGTSRRLIPSFVGVEQITLASRLYLRLRCRLVKLALYAKRMHWGPFGLEQVLWPLRPPAKPWH
jgi:hypothetical protein